MDLSCPICREVLNIPEKAVLFWTGTCPACSTNLHATTAELIDHTSGQEFVGIILAERPSCPSNASLP